MGKTIEAIYENGVFKPTSAVDIKDHARVRITIENAKSVALSTSGIIPAKDAQTINKIALEPEFLSEET